MFGDFYKDRKVFITGHTGFKGSWLTICLALLGAKVKGYSLKPKTNIDHFVVAKIGKLCSSVIGDIRDFEKLKKEIKKFKPEIIFHLAAQSLVRQSYYKPLETYSTNIIGSINLLEIIRECDSVRCFINVTSDKCYRNTGTKIGYKEIDPLGGDDPYSSSKACSEIVTEAYRKSFFNNREIQISTVRAGNVIGGGDWAEDRLIPDIMRAFFEEKKIILRNPESIRPWQYVLEPLSGYLLLASKMNKKFDGPWNFGPKDKKLINVRTIAKTIIELCGKGIIEELKNTDPLLEKDVLTLDSSKSVRLLGWKPKLSISDAIRWTVNWYYEYFKSTKEIASYSIRQVNEYFSI
ncbi:MAG TPA: CDP-glucose 4,6-dehydratase [Victivallales bacterium]|nr:CDP-glucose 4,6-dehydratase [Victivallales bacterium]